MKNSATLFTFLFALAFLLTSCGGGASDLSADAQVDFKMSIKEFRDLEKAEKEKYEGKVIELSGTVSHAKQSHPADARYGKYVLTLQGEKGDALFVPSMSCYSGSDLTSNVGKEVTLKGKAQFFEKTTGTYLVGCVITGG